MRRWLLVLLLLVLPLQFAWAAAAPYCAHEVAAAAGKHPGHHQHAHQDGGDAAVAGGGDAGAGASHPDCASCQSGAVASLLPSAAQMLSVAREAMREHAAPRYRSHSPSGPDRPDIA